MGEMRHTKKLIEIILSPDLEYDFENFPTITIGTLKQFAELALKEIEEQEASERGEQK
jgi:hypothetical protein